MNRFGWMASLAATTALAIGCVALAEEKGENGERDEAKTLALKDLPGPVQETILKTAAGNAVSGFEKEDEDGKATYEVKFAIEKVVHTISVSEVGALLEDETDIDVKALPAPVTEALLKRYGTAGTIKKAEAIKAGDKSSYEVELVSGKEEHEIALDPAGTIVSDVVEPNHDRKGEGDGEHHGKKDKEDEHDEHGGGLDKGRDKD